MALTYLNFIAMVVGYITIVIVLLVILAFIGLLLREKYNDLKWRKQKKQEKQSAAVAQANPKSTEQKEAEKETTQDKPNVQVSIK